FTSMIWAPPSTWCRAISNASSNFSSLMSLKNLREPATLVRSPTFIKLLFSFKIKGSKPDRRMYFVWVIFIIYNVLLSEMVHKNDVIRLSILDIRLTYEILFHGLQSFPNSLIKYIYLLFLYTFSIHANITFH